ncbi:Hypothetical predicted protein [Xyrichtys novacula]|uniref:Uncharacterized protein n=1 Tax=Xyrichtys novacula TaxID=13765 RepID=A0AAV1EMW4_XYRNO|nr:Hypothetical predicted protein [Xyrichtys novacula]
MSSPGSKNTEPISSQLGLKQEYNLPTSERNGTKQNYRFFSNPVDTNMKDMLMQILRQNWSFTSPLLVQSNFGESQPWSRNTSP